jgi:soluble lytic murein transglycosylase-like protein
MLITSIKAYAISISAIIMASAWFLETKTVDTNEIIVSESDMKESQAPSLKLFYSLEKYSEEYGVPIEIAMGIAEHETGYKGPFDWDYNPALSSSANAYGAMQIQVPTANGVSDSPVTKYDLLNDVDLNAKLSMRIISKLKRKYGSWELALGAYNTGRPIVNGYARSIASRLR